MALAAPISITYPRGVIVVSVQNQTTGGNLSDANDSRNAVPVTIGDTLMYSIVISNKGTNVANNDLINTEVSDDLPSDITLSGSTAGQHIDTILGVIKPGAKLTKEYTVKVTAGRDGNIIKNEACFTGNSRSEDSPQKGCDDAFIVINNKRKGPLPDTGSNVYVAPLVATASAVLAYFGRLFAIRRKTTHII